MVKSLSNDLKNSKSIALVGIDRVPGRQFQQIRRMLRGKARIKVVKKTLLKRAFEEMDLESIRAMEDYMDGAVATIFSDESSFRLYREIDSSRTKAPAKGGETADEDMVLEAKPTSLKPGPVVGDLQKAGIPASIDQGRVVIRKQTVVVKKGEKISREKAIALSKLEILPLEIGLDFRAAFEDGIIFNKSVLGTSTQDLLGRIATAHSGAIALSLHINYYNDETAPLFVQKAYQNALSVSLAASYPTKGNIELLLAKANLNAKSLESRIPKGE